MSGHSKWSTIKRKKGAADAKRGKIFTKLIREIATAARIGGGEVDSNPRLRLAVEKARQANMPKDNITRGIKKGMGGDASETYDEGVYEGYGPGGTAVYVEVLTDNKNRTVGEVRHVLTKHGGNLGSSGCVGYLFKKQGMITFELSGIDSDALMEAALDAGAEDVVESDGTLEVATTVPNFESVKRALEEAGFVSVAAEITMEPTTQVKIEGDEAERMLRLSDALDDLDDVQNVYANFDISNEEMARLAG
ncbi:MAG: YebC/PmpR family DNA-binding transcriptional regulator [Deltaproteobacteria bacterium]|nr:YebC/PmpR family DNA-binding transcriptional regulator [Deltaproteobacteria bacterium]MBW2400409.1 YebC/PmpR family DNA-binding transcriptional regulator [Deltaproteobacteria bacterium]MBW2664653.1 YebC/PmpR family DNA-binding transcriptional regulator [Deltaproteobacteria bacterium]